ncbi:MAG TPA: cytochrome c3 family protein [Candidatus Deferrimicrobiaceae bacterium]
MRYGLIAVLLLLGAATAADAITVGDKAPPFVANDLAGNTVWVRRYFGKKPILLNFDSAHSARGASDIGRIERILARYPKTDLQVISVFVAGNWSQRVKAYVGAVAPGSKHLLLSDDQWTIARGYGLTTVPTHLLIDRKGVVRYVWTGVGGEEGGGPEAAIAALLSGKGVPAKKGAKKGAAGDPTLRLDVPNAFTKTGTEMITVAGRVVPGSAVTLRVNGGTPQAIEPKGDVFFARTRLALAVNFLEVESAAPGGARYQQGISVFREAEAGTGIVSGVPPYRFHVPGNEAPCRKCHDVSPAQEKAIGLDPKSNPCLSCHNEMAGRKEIHGPIGIGGCASCHRFRGEGERYGRIGEGDELCFSCHDDMRRARTRAYKHEPASEGRCTACHDPHGSPEKYYLRRHVGDLCLSCHADSQSLRGRSVHPPFRDGRCDLCHVAHGSDDDPKFLRLGGDRFCSSCHADLAGRWHSHPVGVKPKMKLPPEVRLDNAGRLVCRSCHQGHESNEEKLMPEGGCSSCHGPK